jgi:hypothetical protein
VHAELERKTNKTQSEMTEESKTTMYILTETNRREIVINIGSVISITCGGFDEIQLYDHNISMVAYKFDKKTVEICSRWGQPVTLQFLSGERAERALRKLSECLKDLKKYERR